MATLAEIAGLSHVEIMAIFRYANAVETASANPAEVIRVVMGLSENPKVPRPKFSEIQEKVLLIRTGMWMRTIAEAKVEGV